MQYMGVNGKTTLPPMLVGGLSALSLSGLSHYLILGDAPRISLYAPDKLPKWIERLSLTANFDAHSTAKLWPVEVMQNEAYVKRHKWDQELPPVYFSCPEKAILEVLLDVPNFTSFEHADELMQGLVNLSPNKLDELLKACKSVKVKRLFFWLAKRQQYSWFEKLEEKNYDLGSGKRVVAKKGKLDNDNLITVPSHMVIKDD